MNHSTRKGTAPEPRGASRAALAALATAAVLVAVWWGREPQEATPVAMAPASLSVADAGLVGFSSHAEPLAPSVKAPIGTSKQAMPNSATTQARIEPPPAADENLPQERGRSNDEASDAIDPDQLRLQEQARLDAAHAELDLRISAESTDMEFRDKANVQLLSAAEQLATTGVQLVATDCRTTLCKVEFWHSDPAAMNEFLDQFPVALAWNTDLRFDTEVENGQVRSVVYLTRDGVAMPRLAAEQ